MVGRVRHAECVLCGAECESVVHVIWECPVYKDSRDAFMAKLQNLLGEGWNDFNCLSDFDKTSFVLGCELWEENFETLLGVVKDYFSNLWEVRKVKLYGDPCPTQLQSQSSAGDPRDATVVEGQRRSGKFGKFHHSSCTDRVRGKLCNDDVLCDAAKIGSVQSSGRVVNGSIAMTAL